MVEVMIEVITALNALTWPGAFAIAALSTATVGLAFAFVAWWRV